MENGPEAGALVEMKEWVSRRERRGGLNDNRFATRKRQRERERESVVIKNVNE